jgi:ribosome-associated toxin RatA of RatAB toxin-antitoxin module
VVGDHAKGETMMRGEGTAVIQGVTPEQVFDFVLDPAQYRKADTKIVWVEKIADTPDGMIAREVGRFLGLKGSVVTRYAWVPHKRIEVSLVHGQLRSLHAFFEIEPVEGGTSIHHVEELEMGLGPAGRLMDLAFGRWLADSVRKEVDEIKRLMESGERGGGVR